MEIWPGVGGANPGNPSAHHFPNYPWLVENGDRVHHRTREEGTVMVKSCEVHK